MDRNDDRRLSLVWVLPRVFAFGRAVLDFRQGRAIVVAMGIGLITGVLVAYWAEANSKPLLTAIGVDPSPGNMEGKEVRFGTATSALYATAATGTSTGSINSMYDSFTPLGGFVLLFKMLLCCVRPAASRRPQFDFHRSDDRAGRGSAPYSIMMPP